MTDGVTLNPGTGGAVVDAEYLTGRSAYVQRVKMVLGDVDADGGDVASDNPMPITATTLPLPTGAATAAEQASILTAIGTLFQAGQNIGNTQFGASQVGTWTVGRSWDLSSSTDSVTIGGSLPGFAATPTVNLGTLGGAATAALQTSMITVLGAPFQAGGNIGNTSFGISGTLPAFATPPTVLLGQGSTVESDISGSITTGGTAQNAQAATATRVGFFIENTSTGDLWFSTKTAAVIGSPSIRIPPGQMYQTPENWSPTGAINIIGATTGQTFTARTW